MGYMVSSLALFRPLEHRWLASFRIFDLLTSALALRTCGAGSETIDAIEPAVAQVTTTDDRRRHDAGTRNRHDSSSRTNATRRQRTINFFCVSSRSRTLRSLAARSMRSSSSS